MLCFKGISCTILRTIVAESNNRDANSRTFPRPKSTYLRTTGQRKEASGHLTYGGMPLTHASDCQPGWHRNCSSIVALFATAKRPVVRPAEVNAFSDKIGPIKEVKPSRERIATVRWALS